MPSMCCSKKVLSYLHFSILLRLDSGHIFGLKKNLLKMKFGFGKHFAMLIVLLWKSLNAIAKLQALS